MFSCSETSRAPLREVFALQAPRPAAGAVGVSSDSQGSARQQQPNYQPRRTFWSSPAPGEWRGEEEGERWGGRARLGHAQEMRSRKFSIAAVLPPAPIRYVTSSPGRAPPWRARSVCEVRLGTVLCADSPRSPRAERAGSGVAPASAGGWCCGCVLRLQPAPALAGDACLLRF